jgi:hypothetical protein
VKWFKVAEDRGQEWDFINLAINLLVPVKMEHSLKYSYRSIMINKTH